MKQTLLANALCLILTASSSRAFTGLQFRPAHTKPYSYSNVVLHMNLFDRFARVAKSNLSNIAGKLEDPEKIMEQALEDMQVSQPSQ